MQSNEERETARKTNRERWMYKEGKKEGLLRGAERVREDKIKDATSFVDQTINLLLESLAEAIRKVANERQK